MAKTFEEYQEEYHILDDMMKCSGRYLSGASIEITEENHDHFENIRKKIYQYCHKEQHKIMKECKKNTGKELY